MRKPVIKKYSSEAPAKLIAKTNFLKLYFFLESPYVDHLQLNGMNICLTSSYLAPLVTRNSIAVLRRAKKQTLKLNFIYEQ